MIAISVFFLILAACRVHNTIGWTEPRWHVRTKSVDSIRRLVQDLTRTSDDATTTLNPYDSCLIMATQEAEIGSSCTCHTFDDGVVELNCTDNCIYCGDGETSSCGIFKYSTNFTDIQVTNYTTSFEYDGQGDRNEILSFESLDCDENGICDSCRVTIDGSACRSCSFCTDIQETIEVQGYVVDCENIIPDSRLNDCSNPPGPGVFEASNYEILECRIPPPANDDCTSATHIAPGDSVSGTISGALEDSPPYCQTEMGSIGAWYTFEGTGATILLSTCSETINEDSFVNIYQGDDCSMLECVDGVQQMAYCPSPFYGGSMVTVTTSPSTTYFVHVSDKYGWVSPYELHLTSFPEPTNDQCQDAMEVEVDGDSIRGIVEFNSESDQILVCSEASGPNHGQAWYKFIAPRKATVRASTCSGYTFGWSSTLTIASGECDSLTCIGQGVLDSYFEGCVVGGNFVDFEVKAGETYIIAVWGSLYSDVGVYELEIRTLDPPQNDFCEDAERINIPANFTGSLAGATTSLEESDEFCLEQVGLTDSTGIWYSFVGTGDFVVATSCSNAFSLLITMYTGTCGELNCVAPMTWNNSYGIDCAYGQKTTPLETEAGQVYYVLVSTGNPVFEGSFVFSIKSFVPAENSDCEAAIELLPNGNLTTGSTDGIVFERFGDTCDFRPHSPGVWYVVVGTGDILRADTCSDMTNFDTVISVYRGGCGSLECIGFDDDGCESVSSVISWASEPLVNYYIRVQGFHSGATGDFGLTLSSFEAASNNRCDGAIALSTDDETVEGSMAGSTGHDDQGPIDCFYSSSQPTLWYYIDGTGSGLKVSTCSPNSTFTGWIQVFQGNANANANASDDGNSDSNCSNLTCESFEDYWNGGTDTECDYQPSAATRFLAEEGIRYFVVLVENDVLAAADSTFSLSVEEFEIAPNDNCETAIPITNITNAGIPIIIGSTENALPDNTTCSYQYMPGVWYAVMGTGETLRVKTCSNDAFSNSSITVLSGDCDNMECITYSSLDEESCGVASFSTDIDIEYFLLVSAGYGSPPGEFQLFVTNVESPPNERCSDAIEIFPDTGMIYGSITNATGYFGSNYSCSYSYNTPTVWYTLNGTGDAYSVSTCTSELTFDSMLSVSTGVCGQHECIAYNNYMGNGCSTSSPFTAARVVFQTEVGVTYYIAVEPLYYNYVAEGDFGLTVSTFETPSNDECVGAIIIQPNKTITTISGSITNSTGSTIMSYPCSNNYNAPDVWYSLVGTGEAYAISTCSSELNFDSAISVSSGSCDSLQCIQYAAYNDYGCSNTVHSAARTVIRTELGIEYLIAVQSLNYEWEGNFTLTVSAVETPPNDDCTSAIVILPNADPIYGSTTEATYSVSTNSSCYGYEDRSPDLWYRVEGTGTSLTASMCGETTTYDSQIALYEGNTEGCDQTCLVANDDSCGTASQIDWFAELGVTYYIRVYGFVGKTGPFELRVF